MSICKVPSCKRPVRAKQMCGAHRARVLKGVALDKPLRVRNLHGQSKNHPLYKTWQGMRSRCNSPSDSQYRHYGGRGIKVCERWDNFMNFLDDVGERPEGMTLDRTDNDGNYEPSNVQWVTQRQQIFNQRLSSRNTSGYRNIHWHESRKKWLVNIAVNRKTIFIGRYDQLEDAIEAQKGALEKYGKHFIPLPDKST